MEGSSWDNNGSGDPDFGIFCYCGEPTILRKSGTQKNPGRRFFGCANYKKKKKAVRTVEQCESSASMSISEEMQRTTITMQMKIEAMQKEIDAMRKRMRNEGKMNWNYLWIIFFCVVSYMCGKSSQ
ncbi:uncharacterized protein LOC131324146 isoform X2 [Rhododendron vialii]|uniref:uncharacterized protein LOC131301279 n=1 Tax=Rhododendron vialii TaxID=182163 RepID=UPI00265FC663|nr:uncharacterized protein LOC131301279 [Rhododendron vialii]XP_058211966.1 uncharacterized protein LOC131324146 isoform X2 [Rhododendron vialii]